MEECARDADVSVEENSGVVDADDDDDDDEAVALTVVCVVRGVIALTVDVLLISAPLTVANVVIPPGQNVVYSVTILV